ncbi:MAG: hypothetical protein AB1714_16010 [Acidobacteriota bacterium]
MNTPDTIELPRMLLIGSSGRNAGKTRLAVRVIGNYSGKVDIIGLKVTAVTERDGLCPRGGEGCGVCSQMEGEYCIVEELDAEGQKDTSLLLRAGARRVYWLRVMKDKMRDGMEALLRELPEDAVVVAESNSLRLAVKPGLFLMVADSRSKPKPSAEQVWALADRIIETNGQEFDTGRIDAIRLTDAGWECA